MKNFHESNQEMAFAMIVTNILKEKVFRTYAECSSTNYIWLLKNYTPWWPTRSWKWLLWEYKNCYEKLKNTQNFLLHEKVFWICVNPILG